MAQLAKPKSTPYLSALVGQQRCKRLVLAELKAGGLFRHVLLTGAAGLGKSTMARAIAKETGAVFVHHQASREWSRRRVERELMALDTTGYKPGGVATKDAKRYVFFVDECHSLPDFEAFFEPLASLQVVRGEGGVDWIPDTTFIFASSRPDLLPTPLVDRLPVKLRMDPYNETELAQIIISRLGIDAEMASEIARRSRRNARTAINYAESVLRHGGLSFFDAAEIDERGLTPVDREYLRIVRESERPLSLGTIAGLLNESQGNVQLNIEPVLLALDLIAITTKGRIATNMERGVRTVDPLSYDATKAKASRGESAIPPKKTRRRKAVTV